MIDQPATAQLRDRLRADYQSARTDLLRILGASDPMGIGSEEPEEYDLEVSLILPRLRKASSPADVGPILHEVFTHCFGAPPAEDIARYDSMSAAVWDAWQRYPLIHDPHYKLEP